MIDSTTTLVSSSADTTTRMDVDPILPLPPLTTTTTTTTTTHPSDDDDEETDGNGSSRVETTKYKNEMRALSDRNAWRYTCAPLDVNDPERPVYVCTPCKAYVLAVLGCKPACRKQKHQRLYYRFVRVPAHERDTLMGPYPDDPCRWYVFDNATSLLKTTQTYKARHQAWVTLQLPVVRIDGVDAAGPPTLYHNVPLKLLTTKYRGPGFVASSPERVRALEAYKQWTTRRRRFGHEGELNLDAFARGL